MKLDKTNVCVKIVDEAHLQQVRELLERYGQEIYSPLFDLWAEYLHCDITCNEWWITDFEIVDSEKLTQITISELEEILKEEV